MAASASTTLSIMKAQAEACAEPVRVAFRDLALPTEAREVLFDYILKMQGAVSRLGERNDMWKATSDAYNTAREVTAKHLAAEEAFCNELRRDKDWLFQENARLRAENDELRLKLKEAGMQAPAPKQPVVKQPRHIPDTNGWFWSALAEEWVEHPSFTDDKRGPKPAGAHPRAKELKERALAKRKAAADAKADRK